MSRPNTTSSIFGDWGGRDDDSRNKLIFVLNAGNYPVARYILTINCTNDDYVVSKAILYPQDGDTVATKSIIIYGSDRITNTNLHTDLDGILGVGFVNGLLTP